MGRPLWDKRTPFWLAIALISLGVFVFLVWRGERELARQEDQTRVAREKLDEENKKVLALANEATVQGQLNIVGLAYQNAFNKLGRAPKNPDELAPFLRAADGLISPRDRQPFDVAWGTPLTPPGKLLAWESSPWEDGGRIVLLTGAQAKRVSADEFKKLSGGAAPGTSRSRDE